MKRKKEKILKNNKVKVKAKAKAAKPILPKKRKPGSKAVAKNLSIYKKVLTELRRRIVGGLSQLEGETLNKSQKDATGDLSGYSLHMADAATDNFDLEFTLNLAANEQQSLNLIDAALRKIDDGTFGVCEECSKPIAHKRLMVIPYGRLCLSCQEVEEKKSRRG